MKKLDYVRARLRWATIRDSLWFIPGLLTVAGGLLAQGMIWADGQWDVPSQWWIFGGGAEGARGVLSAIAGSLITVTGVIFSVTIVALQLASTQFTPRVLRNFMADRANQVVLGVFIGTFTYTLLVLRSVRSKAEDSVEFVPALAVALAVLLVIVSIGFLIFFVHHAARSIQASFIMERVTRRTLQTIDDEAAAAGGADAAELDTDAPGARVVTSQSGGYLQAVDEARLLRVAERHDARIRIDRVAGEYVIAGESIATVWAEGDVEEVVQTVRKSVVIGPERTPEQDLEFGLVELSDIAVKALSKSLNDPTTAMHAVDRLAEILTHLADTELPPLVARSTKGAVRLVRPLTSFERAVGLAFGQIRHFGADNPAMVKRLLDVLGRVRELVPPSARPPLEAEIEALRSTAAQRLEDPSERTAALSLAGRTVAEAHARRTAGDR